MLTFEATRWSLVLAAGDRASVQAEEALAALCTAYWYPLYAFIRRRGQGCRGCRGIVAQGFFALLIEKEYSRRSIAFEGSISHSF